MGKEVHCKVTTSLFAVFKLALRNDYFHSDEKD